MQIPIGILVLCLFSLAPRGLAQTPPEPAVLTQAVPTPVEGELTPAELEARLLPLASILRPAEYRVLSRSLRASRELLLLLDPPCLERIQRCFDSGVIDHALLGDLERLLGSAPQDSERIQSKGGQYHKAEFFVEVTATGIRERELPLDVGTGVSLLIVPETKLTYGHESRLLNVLDADAKLSARSPALLFQGLPMTPIERATAGQGVWTAKQQDDVAVGAPIVHLRGSPRGIAGSLAVLIDLDARTGMPLGQAKVDGQGKLSSMSLYRYRTGPDGGPTNVPASSTSIVLRDDRLSLDSYQVFEYSEPALSPKLYLKIDNDVMLVDKRQGKDNTMGRDPAKWPALVLAHVLLPGQTPPGTDPVQGPPVTAPGPEPAAVPPAVVPATLPVEDRAPPAKGLDRKAWIGIGVGVLCIAAALALWKKKSG